MPRRSLARSRCPRRRRHETRLENRDARRLSDGREGHPEAVTRHGKRIEVRSLEKVPDEVRGEALTVSEPAGDVDVIERVGETRLDHDERRGEQAKREK